MKGLKERLQAKLAGASSRLKGQSLANDRSARPSNTLTPLQPSRARSPSTEEREDHGSVENVEVENSNTQPADTLISGNASGTQRFGLQVLAEPDPGTAANVDIVFLHGLNGDPFKTWTAAGAEAPWPQLLLPAEIPRARIMTYGADFSYAHWLKPAGQNTVREHAENLVTDLVSKRYRTETLDRPIIFVAYSLGGLVCENALVLSNNSAEEPHRRIAKHTHGIVFLGTPHAGSDFTRFAKAISNIVSCSIVKKPNKAILGILSGPSEVLASIQKDFQSLVELRRQNHRPPIGIHCCQEELPVAATGHRVVTPDSAAFPGYHTSSTIPANHMDLPKFRGKSDIGFQRVSSQLRRWTDALSTPIDLNGLRYLAKDLEELESRIHDRWRHRQKRPYQGSAINWDWMYDSYEYRTWSSNTVDRVGNLLWLSDQDAVRMSLYLSSLVSTHSESCLPASSDDIVYFFYTAPPPELDVELNSDSLDLLFTRGRYGSPLLAAVLCVFIAQIFKSRGGYFQRLGPSDHAALMLAFQATKVVLHHNANDRCPPEDPRQALEALEDSEEILWSIFEGSVTAKRWRSLVVVLDCLNYVPSDERGRFLERLSKLQEVVSKAEGSLRPVVSWYYFSEAHRKILPGVLKLDRAAERADCLKSFRAHAGNRRRRDIDTAKAYTGAWLFDSESYKTWKRSDRSCMLSIQGKPGSGKSTLMKHILESLVEANQMQYNDEDIPVMTRSKHRVQRMLIQPPRWSSSKSDQESLGDEESEEGQQKEGGEEGRINYPDIIVASYFFHARGGETSHSDMLESLIYQIISQDGRLFSACEKRYRRLREQSQDRSSVLAWGFEELKHAFLEIVRYRIPSEGLPVSFRYFFLIDALDESDDEKVEQIINLFRHDLGESPHIFKTVLASRPIRNFDSSQSAPGSFHTILEGHNEDDIGIYTDSEMFFLLEDTDNSDQESRTSLFLSITKYIKENARGVFLWVVLICRALKRYTRTGYSPAGLKKELASLPKDLEGFYQMMTQRLHSDLEPRALQEARKILNWTLFARRPLTMAEMGDVIAIPLGDGTPFSPSPSFLEDHRIVGWRGVKQKLRHTCGDLLEIIQYNPGSTNVDENDTVQLIHETVREFLLHDNEIAKPLHTNLDLGIQAIIEVCVRYLEVCFRDEAFVPIKSRRLPSVRNPSTFEAEEYQQFVKALASLPLLWYILRYLFEHLGTAMLQYSGGNYYDAIVGCFKGWNHSSQKHILFLLEGWIRFELQGLPGDADLSFLDSVMPEAALEFRSGCLLAAAKQTNQKLILDICYQLGAHLQEKDIRVADELLFAAATSGDALLVACLLTAGLDEVCRDEAWRTPLHCAAENGHEAVIEEFSSELYMPDRNRNNPQDRKGQTQLHYAAARGHVRAADALIRKAANEEYPDYEGRSPLHHAAANGPEAVIERLLSGMNSVDMSGQSPLHYAAAKGHAGVSSALVREGADLLIRDERGRTPLHAAARAGHEEIVRRLIDSGAPKNARDDGGDTVLHYAARQGNAAIVERLLSFNVDIETKNKAEQTAQDVAIENGHHGVADALQASKRLTDVPGSELN